MTANDPSQPFDQNPLVRLSAEDARVLDLLVEAHFDLAALKADRSLDAADEVRAERLIAQLGLLEAYPIDESEGVDAETLFDATMARIDRAERERGVRMRLDPVGATAARRGFRFPDLIAVASIAILAAVVLVPLLNWRNARAIDVKCENNLRMIAQGLETYTQAFDGAMPMTAGLLPDLTSGVGGGVGASLSNWLGYRNADNLNVLKSGEYCSSGCLCCPGDHDPNGCYAYQVTVARPDGKPRRMWMNGPGTAVVGDRNPLVDLKRNGETVASVALNSASHGGRGQNLLFSDGEILFSASPYLAPVGAPVGAPAGAKAGYGPGGSVTGGRGDASRIDNIWLPFGDRADSLLEGPIGAGGGVDAFLLH